MIGPIRLSDEAKAGKCRERVGSPDGSHLSPDGGSLSLTAPTAWQRMATIPQQTMRLPRT